MKIISFMIVLMAMVLPSCNQKKINVFYENAGVVSVEAENYTEQTNTDLRKWYLVNHNTTPVVDEVLSSNYSSTASRNAYIEILPDTRITHDDELIYNVNFTEEMGAMAVVSYYVHFENPGKYYVWVRAYSTGTEDNGVHVGINDTWPDSGRRMQWCEGKNEWTWASKQRTEQNHCGEEGLIYLEVPSKGIHKISLSMREDGFRMDKWVMSRNYEKPEGAGPEESKSKNTRL
jgi:hypothetical protein